MKKWLQVTALGLVALITSLGAAQAQDGKIVQDAEYYVLEAQNNEKWATEDVEIDKKLAEL